MRIISVLLFCLLTFSLQSKDYYPVQNSIDVIHYEFTVYLSDNYNKIRGEAKTEISHTGSTREIVLDLVNLDEEGRGMIVEQVTLDNESVEWDHCDDRLHLYLPGEKKAGESSILFIKYHGVPADGLVISMNRHGRRTFFADNWPDRARNWIPCIDHPSDKALVDFIVYAPQKYRVVSNGYLHEESTLPGGMKLTHWKEEISIPTKVMVIGVAEFATRLAGRIDGTDIWTCVFPEDREAGFSDYSVATGPFEWYSDMIGPYPYEKLANVQSKTMFGGMENAGCIFYSESSVTGRGRAEGLIAHEIAHQWFGNSVSEKDWHHIWLSEGFATYLTALYQGHREGEKKLEETMERARHRVIRSYRNNPVPVIDTTIASYMKLLNANSYQKGSWVLHMLHNELGDDLFWAGIREYYARYRDSNALTSDFVNTMEDVSGRDLDGFFHQWLYIPGHPRLNISWSYDRDSKEITLLLEQSQQGHVFEFPLDIQIDYPSGSRVETIMVKSKKQSFVLESASAPLALIVDPGVNLLFEEVEGK